jgi:hypothetical protein
VLILAVGKGQALIAHPKQQAAHDPAESDQHPQPNVDEHAALLEAATRASF